MVFENYEELIGSSPVDTWLFELSPGLRHILSYNNPNICNFIAFIASRPEYRYILLLAF
jgi:hypothetical protein